VLGADTTVVNVIDNQIIGKPIDLNDTRQMYSKNSGHTVLTGVALNQTKRRTINFKVDLQSVKNLQRLSDSGNQIFRSKNTANRSVKPGICRQERRHTVHRSHLERLLERCRVAK